MLLPTKVIKKGREGSQDKAKRQVRGTQRGCSATKTVGEHGCEKIMELRAEAAQANWKLSLRAKTSGRTGCSSPTL